MRILIMGLPGSGKTTLSQVLVTRLRLQGRSVVWLNADEVRGQFNDWDFSTEGRERQASRMASISRLFPMVDYVICEFVAPTKKTRELFSADLVVWMNTIATSRYEDTNTVFEKPSEVNLEIMSFDGALDKLMEKLCLSNQV